MRSYNFGVDDLLSEDNDLFCGKITPDRQTRAYKRPMLEAIVRLFGNLPFEVLIKLYASHVCLTLQYGGPAIPPCTYSGTVGLKFVHPCAISLDDGFLGTTYKGPL